MSKIHESGKGEHLRLPAGFRYKFMDSSVVLFGAGTDTSGERASTSTADKNIAGFWTESSATSGTTRGIYWKHYITGASADGGECARFRTDVSGAGLIVGGGVHGAHITAAIGANGQISGLMAGVRATYEAADATKTITGTVCALQVDSFVGTGNTLPAASHAFIRVANNGAVAFTNLFQFATNTTCTRKGSAVSSQDGIAFLDGGTVRYIMIGA